MGMALLDFYKKGFCVLVWLCCAATAMAQPVAAFTVDKMSGCSPLTVRFTNTTTGASANATYEWRLGNGSVSNNKDAAAIYYDENKYTVTLTVKDGAQTSTKTETITVYKKPAVDFSVVPGRGCAPMEAMFSSTATPGDGTITDYFWDFGDGSTDQGIDKQSIKHTYTFAQKPPVSLTVTNSFWLLHHH